MVPGANNVRMRCHSTSPRKLHSEGTVNEKRPQRTRVGDHTARTAQTTRTGQWTMENTPPAHGTQSVQ